MTPRILIVEDDMMMRPILELYSEQCGFICVGSVQSGEETLEVLENNQVDIVLIDIYLKTSMNGFELAEKIELKFNLPIIFITAKIEESLIENNISKNIYGFLFKPIHKNNFKSSVYFALAKDRFNKQKHQINA